MASIQLALKRIFGMLAGCTAVLDPRVANVEHYTLDGMSVTPRAGSLLASEDGTKGWRHNCNGKWVPVHPVLKAVAADARVQKFDSDELYVSEQDRPVKVIIIGSMAKDNQTVGALRLRVNGDNAFGCYGNLTTAVEAAVGGDLRLEERRFGDSDDSGGLVASLTHGLALIDSGEVVVGGYMAFRLEITVNPTPVDRDNKKFWIVSWSMVYPRDATASSGWPLCQVDGKFYVRAPSDGVISTIGIEAGVVDPQGPTFIPGGMLDGATGTTMTIFYE